MRIIRVSLFVYSILFILLLPIQVWAAPAFVGYTTGYGYPVSQVQINRTVQAGSLLVVTVKMSTADTTTVTSPGAVWTKDVSRVQSSLGWYLEVHSAPNVPGGNTTITITKSGSANTIRAIVSEFSGMATSSPAHKVSSASGTSGSVNAGSITTTIDNCILFAAGGTDSDGQGWGAGSGYTMRNQCNVNQEPDQKLCTEDRGPVAAGTYSESFTINSDSWAAALVAYAPAGVSTTHTVTPSAVLNGSISPNVPRVVSSGATTQFSVMPNTGYAAIVGGNCGGTLIGTTYTTNPVTSDCTVSVTFTLGTGGVKPSPPTLWIQ